MKRGRLPSIAPFEYTSLVWAFVFGYLIWHDVPRPEVFVGATIIVFAGSSSSAASIFASAPERRSGDKNKSKKISFLDGTNAAKPRFRPRRAPPYAHPPPVTTSSQPPRLAFLWVEAVFGRLAH